MSLLKCKDILTSFDFSLCKSKMALPTEILNKFEKSDRMFDMFIGFAQSVLCDKVLEYFDEKIVSFDKFTFSGKRYLHPMGNDHLMAYEVVNYDDFKLDPSLIEIVICCQPHPFNINSLVRDSPNIFVGLINIPLMKFPFTILTSDSATPTWIDADELTDFYLVRPNQSAAHIIANFPTSGIQLLPIVPNKHENLIYSFDSVILFPDGPASLNIAAEQNGMLWQKRDRGCVKVARYVQFVSRLLGLDFQQDINLNSLRDFADMLTQAVNGLVEFVFHSNSDNDEDVRKSFTSKITNDLPSHCSMASIKPENRISLWLMCLLPVLTHMGDICIRSLGENPTFVDDIAVSCLKCNAKAAAIAFWACIEADSCMSLFLDTLDYRYVEYLMELDEADQLLVEMKNLLDQRGKKDIFFKSLKLFVDEKTARSSMFEEMLKTKFLNNI